MGPLKNSCRDGRTGNIKQGSAERRLITSSRRKQPGTKKEKRENGENHGSRIVKRTISNGGEGEAGSET